MGTLDTTTSGSRLETEHERILERLLKRGEKSPELQSDDQLQGDYSSEAIELARENWRERMVHEHESAAVFTNLLPPMMEAEVALDFKTVLVRSGLDELRHAGLCGQVVQFLGGEARAEADLEIDSVPEHPDCSPLAGVLRNVMFASCFSETVSMALLTAERELVDEPFVDRVLKQLAGDESLHARLGWVFLSECWEATDGEVREPLEAYLPAAFASFEEQMLGAMPLGEVDDDVLEEAEKLGFSDSERSREILYDTIETVVVPQLEEIGLAAGEAWTSRDSSRTGRRASVPR
jgi:hypothetical protein